MKKKFNPTGTTKSDGEPLYELVDGFYRVNDYETNNRRRRLLNGLIVTDLIVIVILTIIFIIL